MLTVFIYLSDVKESAIGKGLSKYWDFYRLIKLFNWQRTYTLIYYYKLKYKRMAIDCVQKKYKWQLFKSYINRFSKEK